MVSSSRIFLLGEALIDLIQESDQRYSACLGGSIFNVGLALARLACAPVYLNRFSMDAWGRALRQTAVQEGLGLTSLAASRCATALAVVSLDAGGQPQYAFYRAAVADRDWTSAEVLAQVQPRPGDLLHTGGLALMPEDWPMLLEVLQAWRAAGAGVSMDLNVRMAAAQSPEAYRQTIAEAASHADLLKVSDEDLMSLGVLARGASSETACTALRGWLGLIGAAPLLAVLTRGSQEGWCLARGASPLAFWPPEVARPVDPVGAGDCFWAAMLAGLSREGLLGPSSPSPASLQSILALACRAAAHTIQRRGCDPIRATELF